MTPPPVALGGEVASTTFPALGTTATVCVTSDDPEVLAAAVGVVRHEVEAMDAAASRFRPDSELAAVNAAAGAAVSVSDLMIEAVTTALRGARITDGLVDPTVGSAMRVLGYDRDFGSVAAEGPPLTVTVRPIPGWRLVWTDADSNTVRVPAGVELDLGATAKALCADRAATRAGALAGVGVLVSLGGDLAVAGPAPAGGWSVLVTDRTNDPDPATGQVVAVTTGGLATSGVTARRWGRGGRRLHHVVDPATGWPADGSWRTVSVAAASCVDANIASTAAIVVGAAAPAWLAERNLPARLVANDGRVTTVAGWPEGSDPVPA